MVYDDLQRNESGKQDGDNLTQMLHLIAQWATVCRHRGEKMFGWFGKKQAIVAPVLEEPAAPRSLQPELAGLLESHGLKVEMAKDWVYVNDDLPLLRGTAYCMKDVGASAMLQIDYELRLADERTIVESYAGYGADKNAALGQGLFKFCAGAFHVFLSAYWQHHEPEQVEIESWTIDGSPWKAFTSALINNTSEGQTAHIAHDYMERLQAAVSTLSLDQRDHWISVFIYLLRDEMTTEVRVDNAISAELTDTVRGMAWPEAEGYYSQRQFILLRPAD